ncbi:nSTAND1 domain-containing NTPase [Demequina maris]|uniref:nSTAND1 domain-containing NTPase n=1 Tax=Demequina maris TaxID=1638982 RepID=UPI00155AFDD4|nr:BTAD domain-containing putative transcriptional regulator [Demequina maris]
MSPREQAVLEALLVARPACASADRIAEALWSDDPPKTWLKQLQAAIGRLRKVLGPDSISTTPTGYRIVPTADGGTVEADVDEFEAAVDRARGYSADGEHQRAVTTLERALSLWRAPPYEAIADWPAAHDEAARLAEVRESALDDLLEARLAAGDHRAVAEHATALVASQPYRERRWHALALAQYRCERQADALDTTRRAQRLLVDELGIDPGPSLAELEDAMLRQDAALLAPPAARPPSAGCPYKGLSVYESRDADLFFGREGDVAAVLDLLDRTGFVTITGPSGIGKSSLLRAGVIPELRRRGLDPVLLGAAATPAQVATASRSAPLMLDDVGRAFGDPERAAALADALADAHAAGARIAIVVQSLQLDACVAQPRIGALVSAGLHLMAPPTAEAIRDVVEQPAQRSGLTLEHGLVDVVLHDVARVDASLPLLSHSLAATWERREGSTLTIEAYESTGGVLGAVARSAERVFLNLGAAERVECRTLMQRLVEVGPDGSLTLHAADPAIVRKAPARAEAVARLVAARLVVARADGYVLAHESLARAWPRLAHWLEEDAEASRHLAHLTAAAAAWDDGGRSPDDLYRGSRLATVVAWRDGSHAPLAPIEEEFLDHSAAAADEVAARERRRTRRTRGLTASVAAAAVALVALGATTFVLHRSAEARRQDAVIAALTERIGDMAAWSRQVAALLAAEVWSRVPDDPRARAALFDSAAANPDLTSSSMLPDSGGLAYMDLGTGTHVLVSGAGVRGIDDDTDEVLWEVAAPTSWADDGRRAVAASEDGTLVVVLADAAECDGAGACGALLTIDATTGQMVNTTRLEGAVPERVGHPLQVQVDAVGTSVATVNRERGTVELRNPVNHRITGTIRIAGTRVDDVALAAARTGEIVVAQPGQVRLVDPRTGQQLAEFPLLASATGLSAAVADDGTLVTAGAGAIAAVDPVTGDRRWVTSLAAAETGPCGWLAVDDHASHVYCADFDGAVSEWDLATGLSTGRVLTAQPEHAGALVLMHDELTSVAALAPVVTTWTTTGDGAVRRSIAAGQVMFDGYSPSGALLLVSGRRSDDSAWDTYTDFGTWDVAADRPVDGFASVTVFGWIDEGTVLAYGFAENHAGRFSLSAGRLTTTYSFAPSARVYPSGDGSLLHVIDANGQYRTIDADTGAAAGPPLRIEGAVDHAASSPDGSLLVISSTLGDGTPAVQVFDAASGGALSPVREGLWLAEITDEGTVAAATAGGVARLSSELDLLGRSDMPGRRVSTIQFSDEGDLFVVGGDGNGSMVFDTASGLRVAGPLTSDSPYLWPAALRPDGRELAVTTSDGIDVWSLDPKVLRDAACASAGRDLTAEEWETYLAPLGEWRSTCGFGDGPPAASS